MKKRIVFSSIQPSGQITLGNYLGCLLHWKSFQKNYKCIYGIADLHSITTKKIRKEKEIYKFSLDLCAYYLSCGINHKKSIIFLQSEVPQHTQLYWILNCFTKVNDLKRMTQFKKILLEKRVTNSGIFTYPVLMASDILLYQTNLVPIGLDQKQHMELVKKIGKNFNAIYGKTFILPKYFIPRIGSKIMSLQNPKLKMSKSDPNNSGKILVLENVELIKKKILKSVTDSENPPNIRYDLSKKPGVSNLLEILACIKKKNIKELEKKFFDTKSYKKFKCIVAEEVCKKIEKIQKKYFFIRKEENYLKSILLKGSIIAKKIAKKNLTKIYQKLHLK